jgi:hypothetical protein
MNKRIYLITVRWKNNNISKHGVLETQLSSIGNWLRFSAWSWLVKAELYITAGNVYNALNKEQADIEQVMVLEIVKQSKQGWTHTWIWEWIDKD